MDTLSNHPPLNLVADRAAATIDQPEPAALRRLGVWSALATTLFGFGYGLAVVIVIISNLASGAASAEWQGIEAYQTVFKPIQLLPLYPSLLLAPAFTVLMVCVHYFAAPAKRIWSHIALTLTVIYAGMALVNYTTQLVSVQRALTNGELDGLSMLVFGNPHAIFWSLVSCYTLMNLAMWFAAPVFSGGRLEKWIRRLFLFNGYSALLTVTSVLLDSPMLFLMGSLVVWCPLFTAAAALLIVLYSRMGVNAESFVS